MATDPLNELTERIKGRTVTGTGNAHDTLIIHFSDDSRLVVQTRGDTNSASTGGTIESVERAGDTLTLRLQGGGAFEIPVADTEKPVTLHSGGDGAIEYEG